MNNALFTKNFILMFLSNLLICVGFYMIIPMLPVYAVKSLGIDNGKVGFIIGVFALSAVMFRPFMGFFIDKAGRMQVYIPSLILFSLCAGGYALSSTVLALLAVRFVHGISWSGVSTSNSTIVADIVPVGMRGQGMGYFGLSLTIAMALGPALGVFLMDRMSYRDIFILCMCISLTALFASSFVRPPRVKYNRQPFKISGLYEKRVFGIALMEFFYGFASSGVLSFATLHAIDMGIKGIGYFFMVFAFFVSVVRLFGGRVMDRKGPSVLIYSGFVLYMAGCVLLAYAPDLFTFLIAGALNGLGAGFIMPTIMAMMMNVVVPYRRGAASATVFSALDIGVGGGAIAMGWVAQKAGYLGMYLFAAAVLIIPLLWFYFYERKHYIKLYKEING